MKNLLNLMNTMSEDRIKNTLFRAVLFVYLLLLGIVAMLSTGCKKDKTDSAMEVNMTDAPAEFLNVFVDVKEFRIHYAGYGDTTETSSVSGWVTLNTNAKVYDLLELKNDLTVLLASKNDLAVGKVNQIRLVLGSNNYVVTKDSTAFALVIPSSEESGLKIQTNLTLEAGKTTVITIDFDADASIRERVDGTYKMSPVIHLKSVGKK